MSIGVAQQLLFEYLKLSVGERGELFGTDLLQQFVHLLVEVVDVQVGKKVECLQIAQN